MITKNVRTRKPQKMFVMIKFEKIAVNYYPVLHILGISISAVIFKIHSLISLN